MPDSITLWTALIGAAILILILIIGSQKKLIPLLAGSNQDSFLIVGLTSTGKTSLFQVLSQGQVPKFSPVMTQKPNEVRDFTLKEEHLSDKFLLKDYPGHSKLVNLFLLKELQDKSFLKKVKGIVFVVDSSNVREADTLKLLFDVLNITETLPNGVDILLACNKQDLFQSKPVFKIRELLETELTKLIQTEGSSLDKIEDPEADALGVSKGSLFNSSKAKFTFDQLEGNFDFVGGSVVKNQIDKWECWIAERAVN